MYTPLRFCIVILIMGFILVGCVPKHPELSREEWQRLTTREYQGITKAQALKAAEIVFRLADGDDFKFAYKDDELFATRDWFIYVVLGYSLGTDHWTFSVQEIEDGVRAKVWVRLEEGMFFKARNQPARGNALYTIFWERIDYLLGRSEEWMDCDTAKSKLVDTKKVWGRYSALCEPIITKDNRPTPDMRVVKKR